MYEVYTSVKGGLRKLLVLRGEKKAYVGNEIVQIDALNSFKDFP